MPQPKNKTKEFWSDEPNRCVLANVNWRVACSRLIYSFVATTTTATYAHVVLVGFFSYACVNCRTNASALKASVAVIFADFLCVECLGANDYVESSAPHMLSLLYVLRDRHGREHGRFFADCFRAAVAELAGITQTSYIIKCDCFFFVILYACMRSNIAWLMTLTLAGCKRVATVALCLGCSAMRCDLRTGVPVSVECVCFGTRARSSCVLEINDVRFQSNYMKKRTNLPRTATASLDVNGLKICECFFYFVSCYHITEIAIDWEVCRVLYLVWLLFLIRVINYPVSTYTHEFDEQKTHLSNRHCIFVRVGNQSRNLHYGNFQTQSNLHLGLILSSQALLQHCICGAMWNNSQSAYVESVCVYGAFHDWLAASFALFCRGGFRCTKIDDCDDGFGLGFQDANCCREYSSWKRELSSIDNYSVSIYWESPVDLCAIVIPVQSLVSRNDHQTFRPHIAQTKVHKTRVDDRPYERKFKRMKGDTVPCPISITIKTQT